MAYNQDKIDSMDPEKMFDAIQGDMNGAVMPGWEPERMAKVKELFAMYKDVDEDILFANLKYFLEAIMPVCDKYDINMAIHPDDPGWSVFGLPRIISSQAKLKRLMDMAPNPHNGVTFCTGSYEVRSAVLSYAEAWVKAGLAPPRDSWRISRMRARWPSPGA